MSQALAMTAPDWIAYHARQSPSRPACLDLASRRHFTYGEFDRRIDRLANALRAGWSLRAGERVLVLARNGSDLFEIQFACQRLGAVFVPLNWRLAVEELQFIAADAEPALLLHGVEFADQAAAIAAATPLRGAIAMAGGAASPYEDAIARAADVPVPSTVHDCDVWTMIYTSGTTGRPKGAQITYRMALFNAVTLGQSFAIDRHSRNLVLLPMFHTGGLNVFANPVFFAGGVNLVARDFDAAQAVAMLETGEVTHLMGVPTIHAALADQPGFARIDARALRGVAVAGAPCPPALIERYAACGIALRQCWGMTEAGPLALLMPRQASPDKIASSGLPSMFAELAIVDRTERLAAAGATGELVVRGPVVTPGYWKRGASEGFTADGWLKTGDAAWRDDDGFYYIVDRWKDMFISGGENVYPAEIERVLGGLEGIAECAVIGVADARWGEAGRAFVVARAGWTLQPAELAAHCQRHLAKFKVPRDFVLVDALPRNAAGKVLKTELRRHALSAAS